MKLKPSRPGIAGPVTNVRVGSQFKVKMRVNRRDQFITVQVMAIDAKYGSFHVRNIVEVGPNHCKYERILAAHFL